MPKLDSFSDEALARNKAAIELEQKNRRLKLSGLDPRQFAETHLSSIGCHIEPVFKRILRGKGALHYDIDPAFDYASDAYEYFDKCTKHGVTSASYSLLTPISNR